MADILDQIRSAFDGDDTPKKNLALRKAHDEIELLRVALVHYGDKPRMGMVAPMALQQVIDAAFEHTPPPQPTEVSEGEDYRVGQHGEAAPADSCANNRTNFLRQTVSVHHMVSDEEGWKLDSTAPDHVQPPSTHVAGRCCWRRSSLSEAAQVFIRGLQCRAQANAKGEIGAEQVFDILDKTIVARGYLAGMAGDIASGAIGDLEAPATQTVCHDSSAVPDLPVETGNTVPIFGQTERGECRLARGRINDHVSFCHGAPLVRRLRAAFLACPTAHGSPASTPLCWGGAGFKSGHAPNVRTDVNIREQRETEFYNASRNRVYPSPVTNVAVTLEEYFERQIEWSRETFGPALRTGGVIEHIRKELREIEAEPHDLSEWVDVVILAMDGFWRHGGKASDLLPALLAKQRKNMARTWPDWRTMSENSAIEHDRSQDVDPTEGAR